MKTILLSTLLGASTAFAAFADGPTNVVTVVTSPDPQTQLMSMVLTMQAAQQGALAHILLCGPAGDIALQDAPDSATTGQPPRDMSPQGLMQMLRETAGATVEVCAIYLPGRGEDESVLRDGIGVADPGEMAGRLMTPNTRVLSF